MKYKKMYPGLDDYWRMFKARGLRLPPTYFLNTHLFDLLHGTDTSFWLPRAAHASEPVNFDHGIYYMASWTSEIKRSFRFLSSVDSRFSEFSFLDIGCGKGKVNIVWQQLLKRIGKVQPVCGIDYYEPLVRVAI